MVPDPIASSDLTAQVEQAGARGGSFTFKFDPVTLQPGSYFALLTSVSGAPLQAESSSIATEAWDEGVPVRVDGRDGFSIYHGVEIQRQWEDNAEKLDQLVAWLDQSDYVTMSSNRAYGSMTRLPRRYPLTSEYYRTMFTGELGFKLIGSFESYPTLGPFTFPDQETTQALGLWPDPTRCPLAGVSTCRDLINVPLPPAEEPFSVYDHPRVLVFEKTPEFSAEKVRAVLGQVDLRDVLSDVSPKSYAEAAGGLMLPAATWQAQQETSTWSELFDRNRLDQSVAGDRRRGVVSGALAHRVVRFPDRVCGDPRVARSRLWHLAHGGCAGGRVRHLVSGELPDRAIHAHDDLVERAGPGPGRRHCRVAPTDRAARLLERESQHGLD